MPSGRSTPRPLQNRVLPDGSLVAIPERGTLMGNRGGQLHRPDKTLTARRWVSRAWIACALAYKDRREVIMADGHYTQLFFLDEASALAAGHRPCALCRRARYQQFVEAFAAHARLSHTPKAPEIDRILHAERVGRDRQKRTFLARPAGLPDGAMIEHAGSAHVVLCGVLYPWTPAGYGAAIPAPDQERPVLTPFSIVGALRLGYILDRHPSLAVEPRARASIDPFGFSID